MADEPIGPQIPFVIEPVPGDLLAWARQTLDVDDFLEQVRQIESGAGHTLESVIREIRTREAS